jgi:predicted Zn finger-like uncharacterized protein
MIVHCEGCESGFRVDEHLIKPTGSKLRCSKCRHVFVAYPPPAQADEAEEPLMLNDALPAEETAPGPAEVPGIDSKTDKVSGEDSELLNVEGLLADEPPLKETSAASAIDAELDLDLGPAAPAEAGDTLPGLDELDIDLSMLEATTETAEAVPEKGAPPAELELDLDLDAVGLESSETGAAAGDGGGMTPAPEAEVPAADSSSALLDELNFDLEMADAQTTTLSRDTAASATSSDTDEIDISDLEDMLDGQRSIPAAPAPAAKKRIALDQEPEGVSSVDIPQKTDTLDLGTIAEELETTGTLDSAAGEDGLELQLDLDPGTGPSPVEASAEASAEADELDFSDISDMLEQEAKPAAASAGESLEDVDLVIEDTPATATSSDEDLMLDLEALLDEGRSPASAGKPDEASEVLDLDIVPAEDAPGSSTDLEIELEAEPDAAPPVNRPSGAAVGKASLAAAARGAVAATDNFSTDEFTNSGATSVLEPAPVAETTAAPKRPKVKPRRGGSRKPLLAVLGVLVLCVVAALTLPRSLGINIPYLSDLKIPYLSDMDIEIPFIGNIFKSEPEDRAGALKLALARESMAAEFVTNPSAGSLCVVKGQVRNTYSQPRSRIRVTVKLYKAGNTVIKTATVFAGNMLTKQELSSLSLIAIDARLKNSAGTNNMNMGVKPGQSVPFMAVFSNLPAGVDEYSAEVAGSTP